ncbi:alpha/beta hydrolase [Lentzea sp. NPDC051208]|uniref:alpha/beta hydrolase n=1 Tax=Lentzea sp. NPDC051208 TaxID=3154642 RepID=UPI003434F934
MSTRLGATTENITIEGRHGPIPIRVYTPPDGHPTAPLVWVHGGAFCAGDLDQAESHAPALTVASAGRTVVTVDYRLVPRFSWVGKQKPLPLTGTRFPIPLDDVSDAFAWAREQSPTGEAALGGASAGACLSAATTLRLRDAGEPVPSRLVLAYGTFHAALPALSPHLKSRLRGRHGFLQFRASTVDRMNLNYAGTAEAMSNPHAFPGGADLTGFPPALLLDADHDSLRASSEEFAAELTAAGVPVEHHVVPGSRHGFLDKPSRPHFDTGVGVVLRWMDTPPQP